MFSFFSKNRLTCRRCGTRFYRKVVFVSSEQLRKAVDPPRLLPLPPRSQQLESETIIMEEEIGEPESVGLKSGEPASSQDPHGGGERRALQVES